MQYEFIPRILSGAAELEIDFYRDLYELGVWWALLSGHDRETRARRVLERSLYNVESSAIKQLFENLPHGVFRVTHCLSNMLCDLSDV